MASITRLLRVSGAQKYLAAEASADFLQYTADMGYEMVAAFRILLHAKGIARLAEETGYSHKQIARVFDDRPTLTVIFAVLDAFGLELAARPRLITHARPAKRKIHYNITEQE